MEASDLELLKIGENIEMVRSVLILLETDLSVQKSDNVHYQTVKVIHSLMNNIIQDLDSLLQARNKRIQ